MLERRLCIVRARTIVHLYGHGPPPRAYFVLLVVLLKHSTALGHQTGAKIKTA